MFIILMILVSGGGYFYYYNQTGLKTVAVENSSLDLPSSKKSHIKANADKPGEFLKYFQQISIPAGKKESGYKANYRFDELAKAKRFVKKGTASQRLNIGAVTSRGPGNVGGRTRALIVDPDDATHNTWFAGAASGGIWKTTDGGQTWTNLTESLPNLSTNSLAMAASNTSVIYAGTGELYATNYTFVRGDGIFKSVDKGQNWTQLLSTANDTDFNSVNRIIIDPTDPNIVVVCTNTGIYKSIDGGAAWTQTYDSFGKSVQDLDADPTDFNIQYAGVNGDGVYKSLDAGDTWEKSSDGIGDGVRFEIAISPSNPNKVYTSTYDGATGETTLIYKSSDKGATWARAALPSGTNGNFLGEQGWYDNIISVHPFDEDIVFVGGVYVGKYETLNTVTEGDMTFTGVDLDNTQSFLDFVNFGRDHFGGALAIGDGDNASTEFFTVELRFGPGFTQKAHRFTVPADGGTNGDGGAGVPDSDYSFADYSDVPFEVWDIQNNRQLMVSYRDQQNDGTFNLNPRDDEGDPNLLTAREYLFIHNIEYAATADAGVSAGGGSHLNNNLYFFWPILASGGTFPPASDAIMRIKYEPVTTVEATASIISDPRGTFGGKNGNLHADHHNLIMIPIDQPTDEFRILNGNDGGLGISMDGGETWEQITDGYVTTQFYGADKMPGADEYIGGMQDNGTWRSPKGQAASDVSQFSEVLGGDGFEVIWHAKDPQKIMGSIYNNNIYRSLDGGSSFSAAQTGINTGEGPFITRLASSRTSPETVFAVSSKGILRTKNFGGNWALVEIVDNWTFTDASSIPVATSQHDVEVSLANDQIVWAGGGMSDGTRKMFVSTDGGDTFNPVADYPDAGLGALSGLATHPTEENTAFALFSYASSPKVLKTTDLGQTWTDISGFNTNNSTSTNGFPDVFVHSLLVMPHDPNIIWAGTEIGLFESTDNGATWAYANIGLPAVSIWTMKVVDDQVVLGTHGRGIWTVTIPDLLYTQALVNKASYLGNRVVSVEADLPAAFDEVQVYVDGTLAKTITSPASGVQSFELTMEPTLKESVDVFLKVTAGANTYETGAVSFTPDFTPKVTSFTENADELDLIVNVTEEYDSIQFYLNDKYAGSTTSVVLGEVTNSFTITGDGTYTAHAIGYYGVKGFASATSTLTVKTVTGVDVYKEDRDFKMYPNPVTSSATFDIPAEMDNFYTVEVVSASGAKIFTRTLNKFVSEPKVDLSQLKEGVYVLFIKDSKNAYSRRFLKQ